MTLQLGLDGSIKLVDGSDESLRQVLDLTGNLYRAFVTSIDTGENPRAIYWRIVFSILSVKSPIEATFSAYRALRLWQARFGRMPSARRLQSLLFSAKGEGGGVTMYCWQKANYIIAFDLAWQCDRSVFLRNGDSDDIWRLRIQAAVKGLGLAKASLAVCLITPTTADICCVDTHVYAVFTGRVPSKVVAKTAYLAIEERIRKLAAEFNLSCFAAQWAIWDARRGQINSHAALVGV